VSVLNPDHLFEQAEKLILPPAAGPPRQVDLRRAISAAYYGVFHYMLISAADEFVGVTKRGTPRYALIYRSVDHRALRALCNETSKPTLPAKYQRFVPAIGFSGDIQAFANAFVGLQEKRHTADYDPSGRVKTADASLAIATARDAVKRFQQADEADRRAFLDLLLFSPR
jgi:uncharacterized protein (UPF0332 family)